MAHVRLQKVSLEYPIITPRSQAIKTALFTRLGGSISDRDRTVIVRALHNIDLDLADGDRLGIVGHNGAGKSTILKVISRIYEPQSGKVDVSGSLSSLVDITLGMDGEATGWDNIRFRGAFMGFTSAQTRDLAPSIAEFCELGDYMNLPLRTYSSGMFMRLAFAIATSVHPEIIVMDEMIGAGDAGFIDKAVARLNGMLGGSKILVMASHSNATIRKFCNKALWLTNGGIRAFGPVDPVLVDFERGQ